MPLKVEKLLCLNEFMEFVRYTVFAPTGRLIELVDAGDKKDELLVKPEVGKDDALVNEPLAEETEVQSGRSSVSKLKTELIR